MEGRKKAAASVSSAEEAPQTPPRPRGSGRLGRVMRTLLVVLVLLGLLGGFAGTLFFLYQRSKGEPPVVKTESPAIADIVRKAVATGSIVPRREVLIKPRVSGILKKLYVVAGQTIKEGDLIAEVVIIPDVVALTRAEGQVRSANIALTHAALELKRAKSMQEGGVLSGRELSDRQLDHDIKAAELAATRRATPRSARPCRARSSTSP
jgi:HlyD family secretion protein